MSGDEPDRGGPDLARHLLDQAKARARRLPTEDERRAAAEARAAKRREGGKRAKADPQSFGAAIEAFLKVRGWQNESRVHAVLARWPEIAGPEIADHCTPVSLREGELVLTAESTAWATQLRLMARQVADRVNADLGATVVKSVRVNGPSSARARRPGEWRVRGGRGDRDTYG
ncbi:MAG TPA: DciA family protein [Frankiaceae bacterium]|nr:DciA family protein [Frankiaceae bacterium]